MNIFGVRIFPRALKDRVKELVLCSSRNSVIESRA